MSSKTTNIAETIYESLIAKILSEEFPSGSRLPSERELASRYGTNRNTLREAIRKLEHARLVRVRHGQGVTVADFRATGTIEILGPFLAHAHNAEERIRVIIDLLMARAQVLEMAVALAAQRAKDDDIALIAELISKQHENFEARDAVALNRTDLDLINAIIDAAHSLTVRWIANTLIDVYLEVVGRTSSMWVFDPTFPDYLDGLEHAIREQDSEAAVDATRRYYTSVDQKLLAVLDAMIEDEAEAAAQREDATAGSQSA